MQISTLINEDICGLIVVGSNKKYYQLKHANGLRVFNLTF